MAEPARKHSHGEDQEPDDEYPVLLQRWVERPDGSLELLETPLTPEDFLDPQLEDRWLQGSLHVETVFALFELLSRHFQPDEDVVVLSDVKHLLGPGLPGPGPDVSIVRGLRIPPLVNMRSFKVTKRGVALRLVIEVVSPTDSRIRRTDEVDKVRLYERAGIPEYLLVDMPRRATEHRFGFKGYRLSPEERYRPIEPDAEGFLLSETTHLRFGTSEAGDRIEVFDARTGKKLLTPEEVDQAYRVAGERAEAAEERADKEEEARKTAEAELERLRAEIARLRKER